VVAPDEHGLPDGYHTERDADVLTLLRADGSVVARFSARGGKWPEVRLTAAVDAGIVPYHRIRRAPVHHSGKPVRPRDG
jgi:hypothetical protein